MLLRPVVRTLHAVGVSIARVVMAAAAIALAGLLHSPAGAAGTYPWLAGTPDRASSLEARIPPPEGFQRVPLPPGSFGAWLRGLRLKPPGTPVRLFDGSLKGNQDAHVAVVDIDVGDRDLQQCADAIMRLRAEWLLSQGRVGEISFDDGDGKPMSYAARTADRKAFRRYLQHVFNYAGTFSLSRQLRPKPLTALAPGDVFIQGGHPGHAVLVVDVAADTSGARRFLLLQSYMPAQDMHILKNPASEATPWYASEANAPLATPEWTFPPNSLRSWP